MHEREQKDDIWNSKEERIGKTTGKRTGKKENEQEVTSWILTYVYLYKAMHTIIMYVCTLCN